MTALVVSGSRSLVRHTGARDWCISLIEEQLRRIDDRSVWLVTGDAIGPDTWALGVARKLALRYRSWRLDGWIVGTSVAPTRWASESEVRTIEPRRLPLLRNTRMVGSVSVHHPGSTLLAMIDPTSRTRGTEQTARSGADKGLNVVTKTWG